MWVDALQQAIADRLEAALPAELLRIEAEYGDGIALEPPAEIWPCDKAQINATPAVEVWCPDSTRQDDHALQYRHRITVVWTVVGTDEAEIDKRIKRYLLASMRLLDGHLFGDVRNTPLIARGCTFLIVDAAQEQPWVRTAAVEFEADTLDD